MKNPSGKALSILILLIVVGFLLWRGSPRYRYLDIDGVTYKLEIADTPTKRAKGLMNRESLAEKEGMLFIFPNEARHSFWMYNTLIPLKIIWFDNNWKVVHVEENVPPCEDENPLKCPSYTPPAPTKYVVEISPRESDAEKMN